MYCIHGDDPISSYILCLVPSYFTRCNRDDIDSICMIYLYKPSTEVVSSIVAKLKMAENIDSKASRYAVSSWMDLDNAHFWKGSKKEMQKFMQWKS